MNTADFFTDPVNATLLALIVASPLREEEKELWLTTLPFMNAEEKARLQKNLEEEVTDFLALEKLRMKPLADAIDAVAAQN